MMIWLYFILAILMLIFILLLIPLHLVIKYKDSLEIRLKILGIYFEFSSNKSCDNKSKIKNYGSKGLSKSKINIFAKRGILGSFKLFSEILKASADILKKMMKNISVNKIKLFLNVASSSASFTAIKYGQASAIIYPLASVINTISSPKEFMIEVVPDFYKEESFVDIEIDISTCVLNMLSVAFVVFKKYRKLI